VARRIDVAVEDAWGLGELAVTEVDPAEWALEMYGQLRRAVELHTSALQRLVPPARADTVRQGSQSWVEDSAAGGPIRCPCAGRG
jgi:hypothetical protein